MCLQRIPLNIPQNGNAFHKYCFHNMIFTIIAKSECSIVYAVNLPGKFTVKHNLWLIYRRPWQNRIFQYTCVSEGVCNAIVFRF